MSLLGNTKDDAATPSQGRMVKGNDRRLGCWNARRYCFLSLHPGFRIDTSIECQKGDMGFRFRVLWGRRREGPDLPAPALQNVRLIDEDKGKHSRYPLYQEFDTQEEALNAAAIRNQNKNIPLPPPASQATESYF